MLTFLKVYFFYLSVILRYLLGIKSNKRLYLCGEYLINKKEGSWRVSGNDNNSLLTLPKYLYRFFYLLFIFKKQQYVIDEENNFALIDESPYEKRGPRVGFYGNVFGEKPGIVVFKSAMAYTPEMFINKIIAALFFLLLFILLIPSIFLKTRAQFALLFTEIYEAYKIITIFKKHRITKTGYSCIYDKDANALAHLLQKNGIEVIKNPSEDPLFYHNQFIIADKLILCNAYHKDEINAYKNTIFVEEFIPAFPEKSEEFLHKYTQGKKYTTPKKTIGYYSGSSWIRVVKGFNLTKNLYDPYTAEDELTTHLNTFFTEFRNEYSLKIYLHPMEKKAENLELTTKHFKKFLPDVEYTFADFNSKTADCFEESDIAITVFSGVMVYRLYAGFKGIFYNPYFPEFPVNNSVMSKISAKNYDELKSLILQFNNMENDIYHTTYLHNAYKLNRSF